MTENNPSPLDAISDPMDTMKGKRLYAWDEKTGKFIWLSPRISTETVFNAQGECLNDLIKITPNDIIKLVNKILEGAPEAYDTFLEVSQALEKNKDSITEIFQEIGKRVVQPLDGEEGQVLKLGVDGKVIFAEDLNTIYVHPSTHPATMITPDKDHLFVDQVEKDTWNKKLEKDGLGDGLQVKVHGQVGPLGKALDGQAEAIQGLENFQATRGKAGGLASLDGTGKIPLNELPTEALKDTTYDLSPYAKTEDIAKTYSTKEDVRLTKEAVETSLKSYVLVENDKARQSQVDKALEEKEAIIHKGAAGGYASLDGEGKIPTTQLPAEALKDTTYDLKPYAKTEDVARIYATKQEVQAGSLDYTAENTATKGKPNGYAGLDEAGKVPSSQLPSYVDDVLEYPRKADFPSPGEKGKIYVDLGTGNIYRWGGSAYAEISPSLITDADVEKLRGIQAGAEKNNVTSEMIAKWDKVTGKVDRSGGDVSRCKTDGYNTSTVWSNITATRDLEDWIGDFHKRTLELREEMKKRPKVESMTYADYGKLTTKDPNTIYLCY